MPQDKYTRGAFLHLPGVGPGKISAFPAQGIHEWNHLRAKHATPHLPGVPPTRAAELLAEIERCEDALSKKNLAYLSQKLHRSDHWRLLADFGESATYLDIETSGDDLHPEITLIIAKHRGCIHTFTAERNLGGFLDLVNEIELLVTFNGASFDVPQLENHFHIPLRDIAHVDLRWACYHAQLRGGLKDIERAIGLMRPADLIGMDGAEAAFLWQRWKATGNEKMLRRLTRYCTADVIGLEHLSRWIIASHTSQPFPEFHWRDLPEEHSITIQAIENTGSLEKAGLESRLRSRVRALRREVAYE